MAQDLSSALALADRLEVIRAAAPSYAADPDGFRGSLVALRRAILDAGGSVSVGHEDRMRAYGYAASSAMGLDGAVRNWINQVREKAGAA